MVKVQLKCVQCDVLFLRDKSKANRSKTIFCSNTCRYKHQVGKNNPNYGNKYTESTRKQISERRKEMFRTGELKREKTKEHCANISKALTGRVRKPFSEQARRNMTKFGEDNHFYGKKHTLKSRNKVSETKLKQKLTGERCPHWKGGISDDPYDSKFNVIFKSIIRERDNHICQICNSKGKRKLDVHHIDYDKLNSVEENCISLCQPCHTSTNFNRDIWKQFFWAMMNEQYSYTYEGMNCPEQYNQFKMLGCIPDGGFKW